MKQKFGNSYIFLPIGLLVFSGALIKNHFYAPSDLLAGALVGIGVGLMLLPFILWKMRSHKA